MKKLLMLMALLSVVEAKTYHCESIIVFTDGEPSDVLNTPYTVVVNPNSVIVSASDVPAVTFKKHKRDLLGTITYVSGNTDMLQYDPRSTKTPFLIVTDNFDLAMQDCK